MNLEKTVAKPIRWDEEFMSYYGERQFKLQDVNQNPIILS